jgi:hypothetical protein
MASSISVGDCRPTASPCRQAQEILMSISEETGHLSMQGHSE